MSVCRFWHTRQWLYAQFRTQFRTRLSNVTCLYKIESTATRDDVQVFIKKARLCTFWLTKMCPYFQHMWTWLSGNYPLLWAQIRIMRRVHCEKTSLYATFWLTKTWQQISYHTMIFSTSFPSIHLNSHTTTWLFNLQILWRNWLTGARPFPSPPSLLGYG